MIKKTSTISLRSGSRMPVIGLGTWKLTDDTAGVVAKALEMGYRMIDTSGDYGTQPGVGKGIRESSVDRKDIFLVTKIEETDDAYDATLANLRELDQDYVDLMLIHRPPEYGAGEDLWEGLIKAKSEGLARDIGVSNYSVEQLRALMDEFDEMPMVNQIEWSPFGYSQEMLDFCEQHGIIIQAYSPLTRGHKTDEKVVADIAAKYGKTPAQALLRWDMQLGIVPLPKASQVEHVAENFNIFDFELTDDDMRRLSALNRDYSALGEKPVYQQH